jgi:predicted AlkP superfamily pyrophosphatase or phosphodiesterase
LKVDMSKRLAVLAAVVAIWVAALAAQAGPILILISFDGWRWDYTDRANVPNLKALAARGVRSEGLIPSFPTVTFPNHYTIVTGLVPDHHGIVANGMFDGAIGPEKFTMSAATSKDPRWWGGEPIWTTAMKQGLKSAATFWPGSEAIKPTYWRSFDDRVSNEDRVKLALELLKLPEGERPSFNTLYFSEVDHVGHDDGPDSPEVLAAAQHLDQALGQLLDGVDALGLTARTTFVVVSDHGMAQTSAERLIYLDDYVDLADIDVVEWSPNLAIRPRPPGSPAAVEALYRRLYNKHPALSVYKKQNVPAWLQYGTHPRVPPIVGIAENGWTITTRAQAAARVRKFGGAHGYDPRNRDLRGLFVAAGPRVRRGYVAPEFQNIHVYEFMCAILGLKPAKNDGDPAQIANFIAW